MHSIRIQNLRSLVDTGEIPLRKINLLVGKNSSGKSSFVRTFPLLKQSSEVRTLSDVLWFGPYADFGSYQESLSTFTSEQFIEFTMKLPLGLPLSPLRRIYPGRSFLSMHQGATTQLATVRIRQALTSSSKNFESTYELDIYDQKISFTINEDLNIVSLTANRIDFTADVQEAFFFYRNYGILPRILPGSEDISESKLIRSGIFNQIRYLAHGRISDSDVESACSDLRLNSPNAVLDQIKLLDLGGYYKRQVVSWTVDTPIFRRLITCLYVRELAKIVDDLSESMNEQLRNVHYVNPLRATAERYYRIQGLAVDEIDPQGRNLAMFLRNLSDEDANRFAAWLYEHMNFSIRAESSVGHVSLVISDGENPNRVNLADAGFGYSQVLPILAQLWKSSIKKGRLVAPHIYAIEQPELHLHPQMQARLADLFVKLISNGPGETNRIKLILETHSETFINRIGKAILEKRLNPDDVGIYIFDKRNFSDKTTVRVSGFDSEGFLTDWPYGFFDPE